MTTYTVKFTTDDGKTIYHICTTYELALRAGQSMVKAHGGTFQIETEGKEV